MTSELNTHIFVSFFQMAENNGNKLAKHSDSSSDNVECNHDVMETENVDNTAKHVISSSDSEDGGTFNPTQEIEVIEEEEDSELELHPSFEMFRSEEEPKHRLNSNLDISMDDISDVDLIFTEDSPEYELDLGGDSAEFSELYVKDQIGFCSPNLQHLRQQNSDGRKRRSDIKEEEASLSKLCREKNSDTESEDPTGFEGFFKRLTNISNKVLGEPINTCLLYTSPSPRDS